MIVLLIKQKKLQVWQNVSREDLGEWKYSCLP